MSQATLSQASTNGKAIAGIEAYRPVKRRYETADWNGVYLRVQSLSALEFGVYENIVATGGEPRFDLMKCAMVLVSAVDGDGQRIYRNDQIEDVGLLDPGMVNALFAATLKLKSSAPASVEDIAKNS